MSADMSHNRGRFLVRVTMIAVACNAAAGWAHAQTTGVASRQTTLVSPAPATAPAAAVDSLQHIQDRLQELERLRILPSVHADEVDGLLQAIFADIKNVEGDIDARFGAASAERRQDPASAVQRDALRLVRCRIALTTGDAWRLAAAALGEDEPERQRWLDIAVLTFRKLRVDYHDLPISLLGYIGEARAHRLMGNAAAAKVALAPVLELTKNRRRQSDAEFHRIARLEWLEVLLIDDPAEALKEAGTWRKSPDFQKDKAWRGRVDWLLARSWASVFLRSPEAGQVETSDLVKQAVDLARDKYVIETAPPYDRLELLARLDAAVTLSVLTVGEILAWANLLAATGRSEAIAFYERARTMSGEHMSAEHGLRFASSLWNQGQFTTLIPLCDELLKSDALDASQREAALQLKALALTRLHQQASGTAAVPGRVVWRLGSPAFSEAAADADGETSRGPAKNSRPLLRAQTLAAWSDVLAASVAEDVRREALRQWTAIQSASAGPEACLTMLNRHAALVEGDGYLMYIQAAGVWEALKGRGASHATATDADGKPMPGTKGPRPSSGRTAEGGAEGNVSRSGFRAVVADLEYAQEAAEMGGEPDVAAHALLLRSRVLAAWPLEDRRAALDVLIGGRELLHGAPDGDVSRTGAPAAPAVAAEAVPHQLDLLLALGLTDEANELVDSLPRDASGSRHLLLIAVAEAMAARFENAEPANRAQIQNRVVRLCQRALAASTAEEAVYAATVQRAARAMLKVNASADARTALSELLRRPAGAAAQRLQSALLLAEALVQEREVNEAVRTLDLLAGEFPDSVEVSLTRGRIQHRLRNAEQAIEAFRQARKSSQPGTAEWWEATLALAEVLLVEGRSAAADEILRVSAVLYGAAASAETRGRLRELQQRLAGGTASRGVEVGSSQFRVLSPTNAGAGNSRTGTEN